jgi:DNA-binding FadR family transcriptional regulator
VRAGLTDRVIDQLRQRITGGTWPLHQRLPAEAALARELGVGRSTVREAVRVLVHAGLLEVRQGDGTFVRARREIDAALRRRVLAAGVLDAFEVRRTLEIEVARLAATRRGDVDVVRLRELAKNRADVDAGDGAAYRRADEALRDHILDTTGNPLLVDLYRGVVAASREALATTMDDRELTHDDPDRPETPELVRAIVNGDPRAAVAAAERHMDNAARVLRLVLQIVIMPEPASGRPGP